MNVQLIKLRWAIFQARRSRIKWAARLEVARTLHLQASDPTLYAALQAGFEHADLHLEELLTELDSTP